MLVRKSPRRTLTILITAALTLAACNVGSTPAPTVDVNTINTAAVATAMGQISSQLTQTALAAPSSTPLPTDTPIPLATFALPTTAAGSPVPGGLPTVSFNSTPNTAPNTNTTPLAGFTAISSPVAPAATGSLGDSCNNSAFEGDITIPDGTVLKPGVNFEKTWGLRNTGSCTWDDGYALVYIGGSNPDLDPYNFEFKKSNDFVAAGQAINMTLKLTTPCTPGKYEGTWRMRNDKGFFFGTYLTVKVEVKDKC